MNSNNSDSIPSVVKLNVGGTVFMTSLTTLKKDADSMLAKMFSGQFKIEQIDGQFFIDRDGTYFRYILNYLRGNLVFNQLPESLPVLHEMLDEATYYGIDGLRSLIVEKIKDLAALLTPSSQISMYDVVLIRKNTLITTTDLSEILTKLDKEFSCKVLKPKSSYGTLSYTIPLLSDNRYKTRMVGLLLSFGFECMAATVRMMEPNPVEEYIFKKHHGRDFQELAFEVPRDEQPNNANDDPVISISNMFQQQQQDSS